MAAVREQDAPVSLPSRDKTRPVVPLAASRRQVIAKKTQRPSTLQRRSRSLSVKITPVIATGRLRFTSACRARPEHPKAQVRREPGPTVKLVAV